MGELNILVIPHGDFFIRARHVERMRQVAPGAVVRVVPAPQVEQEDVSAAAVIFGSPRTE